MSQVFPLFVISDSKILSRKEYLKLIEAALFRRDYKIALLLKTICSTGIRVSELKAITVEAVRKGEALVNCKKKNRRIFIVPRLQKELLGFIRHNKIRTGCVFITKMGRPISRTHIWRSMKRLCQISGIKRSKVHPHTLRHLFARSFYNANHDIVRLADILGHSNLNTTRVYTKSCASECKRKIQLLNLA